MRGKTDGTVARSFPDRRGSGCALGIPVFPFSFFFPWKIIGGGCGGTGLKKGGKNEKCRIFITNQLEDYGVKYAWEGAMYESSGG